MEENIILHNEGDAFKQETEELTQRFNEEIEELKTDLISKDKIINRLKMNREFILRTAYNAQDDIDNNIISTSHNLNSRFLNRNSSKKLHTINAFNNEIKTLDLSINNEYNHGQEESNSKNKKYAEDLSTIEENFRYTSRNSSDKIGGVKTSGGSNTLTKLNYNDLGKFINTNTNLINSNINKLNEEQNEEEECDEFLKEKIDLEIQNIINSRKNFIISTMTLENFSFDILNKNSTTKIKADNNSTANRLNENKINENLDEILVKIQLRKEKVILQKKMMQTKLEKIGLKLF